jgi:hypothetical protein
VIHALCQWCLASAAVMVAVLVCTASGVWRGNQGRLTMDSPGETSVSKPGTMSTRKGSTGTSIPGDGLIHGGVGVEAAFEVEDLLEADPLEGQSYVGAAIAVVADHHGLGLRVELVETLL